MGLSLVLQKINYHKKIYIERNSAENITLNSIIKEYKEETINKLTEIKENTKNLPLHSKQKLKDLFVFSKNKIKIRILYSKKLPNFNENIDKLIIHIHGGGFIGNSSRSHQTYTRQFLNIFQIFDIKHEKNLNF